MRINSANSNILPKKLVNSIYHFEFENLILIRPELLSKPNNRNVSLFFEALCNGNAKRNIYNIYIFDNNGLKRLYEVTSSLSQLKIKSY